MGLQSEDHPSGLTCTEKRGSRGRMVEINAILFDLDGTLIDSEVLYVDAVRGALGARGYELTHEEAVELVYGKGWKDIYLEVCEKYPDSYGSIEQMERAVRDRFTALRAQKDIRISGSIQLLERLAETYPVAIVSGSPRQDIESAVAKMELGRHLEFFLGAEDYFPGKPDPACYKLAAEKLNLPPKQCLVFEDSEAGVRAAKDAGMSCVALSRLNMPPQDVSRADLILDDLAVFEVTDLPRK